MLNNKIKLALAAASGLALMVAALDEPAAARNRTGAIVGGLIAGAAVGAVISSELKHPKKVYVPGPPPPPDPWGKPFSPRPNVYCYPVRRACYNAKGVYNANWTYKVYAR